MKLEKPEKPDLLARALAACGVFGLWAALGADRAHAQHCVLAPSPHPIGIELPDGRRIELWMRGSAQNLWLVDDRGFAVLPGERCFVYASLDGSGALHPTTHCVGSADPSDLGLEPNPAVRRGLLRGSGDDVRFRAMNAPAQPAGRIAVDTMGTVDNLVLLLRFSNHGPGGQNRALPSQADFEVIMNQVGGDPVLAPTGSVRDYYLEASYGLLSIDSTVTGWLDVPDSETYYANGNSGLTSRTWELITDGLNLADPLIDFTQFDQDADGWVDAITFLHSGYGAEWGGNDQYGTSYVNRMWSHKWSIPTWTSAEGVRVSDYNISPGLWGTTGSAPGRIGVVCHELGHFFGLPDLYDTDGTSEGIGNWCLMAAGSWGFSGSQQHPSHMSAWAKMKLGWLSPDPILPGMQTAPRVETNPSVLRVDSGYPPGEYLLIENRQRHGFDLQLAQPGLLVWHVDETKGSLGANDPNTDEGYPAQAGWPGNGNHYRIALLQADGNYNMERDQGRGDGGDPYRAGGVTVLDPTTTPGTDAYQQGLVLSTENAITDISAPAETMSFQYVNPLAPEITTLALPGGVAGTAYNFNLSSTGGSGSSAWSEYIEAPSYGTAILGSSLYATVGLGQNWRSDEGVWPLALPFAFPFYERRYTQAYVSSNGFIDFAPVESEPWSSASLLRTALRIAPLWDDLRTDGAGEDIFIESGTPGEVTVRWRARTFAGNQACRFSVTLFSDGRLRFDYGSGNSGLSPTVGISRGHSGDLVVVPGYSGASSLGGASSVLLTLSGSELPPGLSLAPNGTLSGTPSTPGSFLPIFQVSDGEHRYDRAGIALQINALIDCNSNGIDDAQDIAGGTSQDCNDNGVPDECDADCNANGTPDECESAPDCDANGIPDECELEDGDLNGNGILDVCEADCAPVFFCSGKTSSLGLVPFLTSDGLPSASAANLLPFRIIGNDLIPDNFGFLIYGYKKGDLDYHGGKLCVKSPVIKAFPIKQAKSDGTMLRNFNSVIAAGNDPMLTVGQVIAAQYRQSDSTNPLGFGDTLTNGIRFQICP
jgi:M6 family metalloprotease-like protein